MSPRQDIRIRAAEISGGESLRSSTSLRIAWHGGNLPVTFDWLAYDVGAAVQEYLYRGSSVRSRDAVELEVRPLVTRYQEYGPLVVRGGVGAETIVI